MPRTPKRSVALLAASLLLVFPPCPAPAQNPSKQSSGVLRVTTRLVMVDVVATDKQGRFIKDLAQNDFEVLENGKPQTISVFSLEQAAQPPSKRLPPVPPQVYTNRPEYSVSTGVPTVILLDSLNTPLEDQVYAQSLLVRNASTEFRAGQSIAVFRLGDSLKMLQDFTDDPLLLRAGLASFIPQRSREIDIETNTPTTYSDNAIPRIDVSPSAASTGERALLANEAQVALDIRVKRTMKALRSIAQSLTAVPGRKNVIWVSGSFPLTGLQVDRPKLTALNYETSYFKELQETTDLLAAARVALYPVDARGNSNFSILSASNRTLQGGPEFGQQVAQAGLGMFETQSSMRELAYGTGGLAFINRDEIDRGVAVAVADGSSYYAVGYYPKDNKWDGKFRQIELKILRPGADLRYRRGYYALKPGDPAPLTTNTSLVAAMTPGSPPASSVVFDARVSTSPPADDGTQVQVGFRVDFNTLSQESGVTGGRNYQLEFHVVAIAPNGDWVAQRDLSVQASLKPETFESIEQQGFPFHTELLLPPGRYQLGLAVRDAHTGHLGSTRVPLVIPNPSTGPKPAGKPAKQADDPPLPASPVKSQARSDQIH
jgi:VWFA-related protein